MPELKPAAESAENLVAPSADESPQPLLHTAQNRCFGCGEANPIGLRLKFLLAKDGSVLCQANFTDVFEGPTGYLHGGIIATILDEAMSKSVRARNITAMTRYMEVNYLRPVPSGAPLRLEGRVLRNEGRKHWTEARIFNTAGDLLAHSKGLFIEIKQGVKG
jgi:uncharacterized protein (TIGR00369 family)